MKTAAEKVLKRNKKEYTALKKRITRECVTSKGDGNECCILVCCLPFTLHRDVMES